MDISPERQRNAIMITDDYNLRVRQFLDANLRNDANSVKEMLQDGSLTVDSCDDDGVTALQTASAAGHLVLVGKLLDEGADVELCNHAGLTPLLHAAFHGHLHVVDLLLQYGASAHTSTYMGASALTLACRNGHATVVRRLLDLGVHVDCQNAVADLVLTPLMAAALHNHDHIATILLTRGARVNRGMCQLQFTALMLAAQYSRAHMVQQLLEHGSDPNAVSRGDSTALDLASAARRLDIVCLLEPVTSVRRNTTSKKQVQFGLIEAIKQGDSRRVREVLSAQPEKVREVDPLDGSTPLMHAATHGRLDMVSLLVSRGADLNAQDTKAGWTPLMQSVFYGYTAVARYLVFNDVDTSIRSFDGNTAFDLAMAVDVSDKQLLTLLATHRRPQQIQQQFNNRHRWSKSVFGKLLGKTFGCSTNKSWLKKVGSRFKRSGRRPVQTATVFALSDASANGDAFTPRNPLACSWADAQHVFRDPLASLNVGNAAALFQTCEDYLNQGHTPSTQMDTGDANGHGDGETEGDNNGRLMNILHEAQPDLVASSLQGNTSLLRTDGTPMSRFRHSVTNRRSMRAKQAAATVIERNGGAAGLSAASLAPDKQPPAQTMSSLEYWKQTDRHPPKRLALANCTLAERNAYAMGDGVSVPQTAHAANRVNTNTKSDASKQTEHTGTSHKHMDKDSASLRERRDNARLPTIRIQADTQHAVAGASQCPTEHCAVPTTVHTRSSSVHTQSSVGGASGCNTPLGTLPRSRTRTQQPAPSQAISPPLTPTRRTFVAFAGGSEGQSSPRTSALGTAPVHQRSRSLNNQQHAHTAVSNCTSTGTTGYQSGFSASQCSATGSVGSAGRRQAVLCEPLPCMHEEEVGAILRKLQLEQYIDLFNEQEVDMDAFVQLSEQDLIELGIDQTLIRQVLLAEAHRYAINRGTD